jgi:hypothetical protein
VRRPEKVGALFLDEYVMIAAALITVLSAVEYLVRFRGALSSTTIRRSR